MQLTGNTQQRALNMDYDIDEENLSLPQAARGRNNSKLANKLVRSHAMREEASPPRDVLIAAAAATVNTAESSPCATSSPNTLSPPIQHRARSPDTYVNPAHTPCATAANPVLVLSPSTSPSATEPNPHSIQCYYHHHQHHQHQCQQSPQSLTCTAQHARASPPDNGAGGVMAARRCCSPQQQQQQQQQMLVTVDYVGGEYATGGGESSVDDGLIGGATSHKVNKLNRQNADLCTNNSNNNKQRDTTNIIHEESSQQTKAPKCECNNDNNFHQPSPDRQHSATQFNHCTNNLNSNQSNNNQLTVNRANNRGKLRQQSSSSQSYGSFDGSHSSISLNASPCLSRDNSSEQYTDTTGVDLDTFIPETLNRNAKDRALMLRIEEELVSLAKDQNRTHYKFPPMSSYQRMLVHRCAAYFGMDHNIESSGKCVVVNRTKATRIPSVPFKEHLRTDTYLPPSNYSNAGSATGSTTSLLNNQHDGGGGTGERDHSAAIVRRSILKRGDNSGGSMDEISGSARRDMMMLLSAAGGSGDKRSKSFEEREEEYVKARRRIFNPMMDHEHRGGSNDEFRWSDVRWPSTDSDMSIKNKLHAAEHYHQHRCRPGGRLQKVQSEEKGEDTLRPCVAKSYSFGGYGGCFTRGDSIMSTHSASPRLLTKQDSTTSSSYQRLSPSSSGYKTQSSQRSTESVTPSPTSTPYPCNSNTAHRQDSNISTVSGMSCGAGDSVLSSLGGDVGVCGGGGQMVFWAVTDVDSVPRGSVIINPHTGMVVRNDDGTVYRYDPANPPVGMIGGAGGGGNAKSGGDMIVEKHTNYIETKLQLPEPLIEEPPMCGATEMLLVHSPKRPQHCDSGAKPPSSPNHHYRHPQLHAEQLEPDETVLSYHQHQQQQQQQDVQHCQTQSGDDSSMILGNSPTHSGSPQRRRKNSPFKKQENFVQTSVDKPIMISTYTSTTNSPSPPLYSTPPAPPILPTNTTQPPTPLPSRPSSVLSQHTQQIPPINNNTQQQHHHHQQHQRYGTTAYHMMPVEQQPYMGPPLYPGVVGADGGVVYGPGIPAAQQPCFVYGYGVPLGAPPTAPYNPPMESVMGEVGVNMGVGGYYIADGAGAGAITYQSLPPATWAAPNQISYFAAPTSMGTGGTVGPVPPTTRFSVPMHAAQPASYMYNTHHHASTNYMTCPAAAAAAQLAPTHQPTELISLYSPVPGGQPAVLFSQHPAPIIAPAQNTTAPGPAQLYPAAVYGAANIPAYTPPPQQVPIPPPVVTPQLQQYYSAGSAASTPTGHGVGFSYPMGAPTPPTTLTATTCGAGGATTPIPMMGPFGQIVHGMSQLAVGGKGRNVHHLDRRNSMQRMNKMATGTTGSGRNVPFGCPGGSSQSSTEPSSPATTTIIYGGGGYRLPGGADTPPIGAHPQQFLPPNCNNMLIRPMNTVHSSPPIATMSRSSRSPTPALSDMSFVAANRSKFPAIPAGVYHPGVAMPLMLPNDARLVMRGPSVPFRQLSPHQVRAQQIPGVDRAVRNRKPR